ncbi:MAG: LysR family transcriptional regulator [Spirochaetaceae bacterium]|jgi:lysyl-tRNA synthetase class 2|nr:LysR family transcriptional regulator [Spirochaetaceae bacterium]
MDLETLERRAEIIRRIRSFFVSRHYLELDVPALAPALIPETCLEVFKTELLSPGGGRPAPLYLTPSPEVYIKKIIAAHRVDVFQVSKCYRNCESLGAVHNPEFTMLEYYTMNAAYKQSAALTEEFFDYLGVPPALSPPFTRLTMDEAFLRFAGFRLSEAQETGALAEQARRLGIAEGPENPFENWAWDDLYELILVHAVEPALPRERPVVLLDYPAQAVCLAGDVPPKSGPSGAPLWKERWELYADGVELANCYTEETDPDKIRAYFEREGAIKEMTARTPHAVDRDYWKIFEDFPPCSGVALGVDRLIALMTGSRGIEPVLPFPLSTPYAGTSGCSCPRESQ